MPRATGRGTSTPRERGAYGNKRGKERQRRRARQRAQDPRVQAAMGEVKQDRELVADLLNNPSRGTGQRRCELAEQSGEHSSVLVGGRHACCGKAAEAPKQQPTTQQVVVKTSKPASPPRDEIPREGEGVDWSLGQARAMLMQGYLLRQVVFLTGWGAKWFDDVPLRDGRGVSREEWLESLTSRRT